MSDREKLMELIAIGSFFSRSADAERCIDYLIANGVTVQQWISVEDRLPEPGKRVLTTDGAFVGEMYINKRGKWQRYNVNDSSLLMALDILYWMPLPKVPEGE